METESLAWSSIALCSTWLQISPVVTLLNYTLMCQFRVPVGTLLCRMFFVVSLCPSR